MLHDESMSQRKAFFVKAKVQVPLRGVLHLALHPCTRRFWNHWRYKECIRLSQVFLPRATQLNSSQNGITIRSGFCDVLSYVEDGLVGIEQRAFQI